MPGERPFEFWYRQETSEFVVSFQAMAGPCEALVQSESESDALSIGQIVYNEAKRIEQKYSRYRDDNIIAQIHRNERIEVDEETTRLLNFANTAYELSNGDFDLTSGVLRKLWNFSGDGTAPSRNSVKELLPLIDWQRVSWDGTAIQVPEGMQIDFGGFGKEYAVDTALRLVTDSFSCPVLVNFGGDLAANKKPLSRDSWSVGVKQTNTSNAKASFRFQSGAIATSGDANRYVIHKGKKLSHILNPRTGWPVSNAPLSISVGMPQCLQAGLLTTLAMLKGQNAETFLAEQEALYWVQR